MGASDPTSIQRDDGSFLRHGFGDRTSMRGGWKGRSHMYTEEKGGTTKERCVHVSSEPCYCNGFGGRTCIRGEASKVMSLARGHVSGGNAERAFQRNGFGRSDTYKGGWKGRSHL